MPCKKKRFKKKSKRKARGTSGRLFLMFMMFCLVTSMSLINQDGNIVLGVTTDLSYDFELSTATQQVTLLQSEFFVSDRGIYGGTGGGFVDTTFAYSGTKSYRVLQDAPISTKAYFNTSLPQNSSYLVNMSFNVYFATGCSTSPGSNYLEYTCYDYDDTVLFTLSFEGNATSDDYYDLIYLDHNDNEQEILHGVFEQYWYNIWVVYTDNDTISYGLKNITGGDTTIISSVQPQNVADSPEWEWLQFYARSGGCGGSSYWVDDFYVIVQNFPFWWPGVSGDITINVFNESNITQAVTNYDVYVKTIGGALLYSLVSQSNPVVIETVDIGIGERVFEIYNDSYFERYYIVDMVLYANHTLTAYLPPVSEAFLYYIKVQATLENPLYQVYVQLSRNFNGTVDDIAQGYTDIFGLYPVYLLGGQQYGINLTKTGYDDFTGTFITDPNNYGYNNPIIFELGYMSFNESIITINDVVHFNATIDAAGNIQVWYEDYYSNTTNTNITIYEYYNGTYTFNYTDNRIGDNSFTFTDAGYNTSMMHYIILHVNHTDFSPNHQVLYILLYPLTSGLADESELEQRWTDVFGEWDLGWTKTLLVFLPCILFLCVFGPNHVGLGILGSSLYMGFATVMIDFGAEATAMFLLISSMVAVTGIIMIIAKKGRAAI